ncbi:MAG: decarboxylating 6-phosphogluconate dehydrogenase [Acidimicrobiales bacterium]
MTDAPESTPATTDTPTQLGMVGLGRMGASMVRRLTRAGHPCVAYDLSTDAVASVVADGAVGATDLADLVGRLAAPRSVWIMVPAAFVDDTIGDLAPLLSPGDTIIDGGNSHYHDDIRRAEALAADGITYLDVGTSGGVFGLERGYCLMIGGAQESVDRLAPIFESLAPGFGAAERTPGLAGDTTTQERGWLHCGPAGSGHFVKMVHNGIEYGLMAAYAEGLNVLHHANVGAGEQTHDAETTPLRHPEHFRFDLDIPAITEVWRRGSVVASWLLDLTAAGLVDDPTLAGFAGRVSDSGEGRWTVEAAVQSGVPTPVLAASLFSRFSSRGEATYGDQVLSAMRKQFGGHAEKPAS